VIEALPKGFETMLGKWFEEGVELSTGDWQRVALARAFLRDAPIVVLDEPTSSLDAKVEHEVFGRLRQLARDRTAIFIATDVHARLSTASTCSRTGRSSSAARTTNWTRRRDVRDAVPTAGGRLHVDSRQSQSQPPKCLRNSAGRGMTHWPGEIER